MHHHHDPFGSGSHPHQSRHPQQSRPSLSNARRHVKQDYSAQPRRWVCPHPASLLRSHRSRLYWPAQVTASSQLWLFLLTKAGVHVRDSLNGVEDYQIVADAGG